MILDQLMFGTIIITVFKSFNFNLTQKLQATLSISAVVLN